MVNIVRGDIARGIAEQNGDGQFREAKIAGDRADRTGGARAADPARRDWRADLGGARCRLSLFGHAAAGEHPKLVAGMVNWADDHSIDIEQLAGAPKEAVEIWSMTAKNFRGHTVAGDSQRENTVRILQRFGDGRRHSVAVMASSLNLKEKFLAGILDMMFRSDFKNTISREPDGRSWKYTMRRPT